jgi:hypothetical protein
VVFSTQRRRAERYLLIAQDDHARLAGDLAAVMTIPGAPRLDAEIVEAIRQHDCGWRTLDAQLIACARNGSPPLSFLDMSVPEFLFAWTQSIEQVAARTALGGAMVSLHFSRLAEYRLRMRQDEAEATRRLEKFVDSEADRRRGVVPPEDARLARLTDLLQLCDLISLFVCCGAEAAGVFSQAAGRLELQQQDGKYSFSPAVLAAPLELAVPAIAWPAGDEEAVKLRFLLER